MSPAGKTLGVVVTACNAEPFLASTLAALAGQSRAPDEVVLHDAASTDDTLGVARRWDALLPLRVVASSERTSAGESRNRALRALTTDLVAIVDHDDSFAPDHLSTMAALHVDPNTVVSPRTLLWTPGRALERLETAWRLVDPPADRQLEALASHNFLVGSVLASRERLLGIGGYANQSLVEDWDLWLRLGLDGARFVRPDHATMLYRWGHGSTSGSRAAEVRVAGEELLRRHGPALREALGRRAAGRAARAAAAQHAWPDTHRALLAGDWSTARKIARKHVRLGDKRLVAVACAPASIVRRALHLSGQEQADAGR